MDTAGNAFKFYGKFRAYSGVFIVFVIGISLIAAGAWIVKSPVKYVNKTTGTATNVNCANKQCTASVSVTVKSNTYTPVITYGQGIVEKSTVDVYYDNSTPPLFSGSGDPPKIFGYGMISVALCCSLISILIAYVVSQSNTAAKVFGGVSAISNVSQFLKSN